MFRLCAVIVLVAAVEASYRRVCYHTNWSQYRQSPGKFLPENIDPRLCTHINYAFAKLNGNHLVAFEWNDESTPWNKGMYERFQEVKRLNPSVKTLLSVGGWNMASQPFTQMVATASNRLDFATSSVTFLRNHGFDGLDIDWEYPTKRGGSPDDRDNLTLMLKIVREEFEKEARTSGKPRLLLTAAVPAGKENMEDGYDWPQVIKYLDFINLMAYDLHGPFEDHTDPNAPLFSRPGETGDDLHLNVDWALEHYLQSGIPPAMINLGMPLYGHSFTLRNAQNDDLMDPISGPGQAGQFTREAGYLAYYEICKMIPNSVVHHLPNMEVPYLVQGSQWVSYDDKDSLRKKVDYMKSKHLGGVMVWALDTDDFTGSCGEGKFPLLTAINNELTKPGSAPVNTQSPVVITNPSVTQPPHTNPPMTQAPHTNPPITQAPHTNPPITQAPHTNPPMTQAPHTNPPMTQAPHTNPPVTQAPHTNPPVTAAPHINGPTSTFVPEHTINPTVKFTCSSRKSGFYANPASCYSYYICAGHAAWEVNCSAGLKFNPLTLYCDFPYNVACNVQHPANTIAPQPTQTTYPPTAATTNSPTAAPTNPPTAAPTNPPTMAPTNPPVVMTTKQQATPAPSTKSPLQTAKPSTHAPTTNSPMQTPKPTTVKQVPSTNPPAVSQTPAGYDTDYCKTLIDGLYHDPADCGHFYQCAYGLAFHEPCPPGLAFNENSGVCDYAINVPGCPTIG